jgi:hypothetical protein
MNIIKVTPENVLEYIGNEIIFKSRKVHIVKRILGVSKTGKSIIIDDVYLKNNLQIVSRKVYAIL